MKLAKFIETEQKEIQQFLDYWKKNNKKDPENWPMEMSHGEWWEQFLHWQNLHDEDKLL